MVRYGDVFGHFRPRRRLSVADSYHNACRGQYWKHCCVADVHRCLLARCNAEEDGFYMDLLKAKVQYLRTREYWDK